ncbi:hypothetical protein ATX28_10900, partial [Oenococcus oeni]|uniref:hypothetical protein n=1 Tax=Oenococcus oeni TaxID=1247 RepID=UPI000951445B
TRLSSKVNVVSSFLFQSYVFYVASLLISSFNCFSFHYIFEKILMINILVTDTHNDDEREPIPG